MVVRVGVIGTGFGASVQIPGFQLCDGATVVAVASGRLERAREVAAHFGIPHAFDDYRQMLSDVPLDLVSVVTPPYLHAEMVLAAVERGLHVICEKPFALDLAEAQAMLAAAERRGVVHALDHEFRYLPARARFQELVAAGYVGEPRVVRAAELTTFRADPQRPWNWWSDAARGGGMLGAIGSHYFDTLRWCFGEIVRLGAQLQTFIAERPLPDDSGRRAVTADDTVAAFFQFASGAQGTLQLSAVARHPLRRIEVYGSAGSLILEHDERLLGGPAGEPLAELEVPERLRPKKTGPAPLVAPFVVLAERVLARIRGEPGPDFPTFHEGVAVQALLDATRRSSAEGRVVALG
jgi:predicted dehydrogenase